VDGAHVYVLSDVGVLACLKVADGTVVWSVDLVADFGGSIPKWGYSESPLIDGDRVVVTPGNSTFLVALNKKSGEKIWASKTPDTPAHYVSVLAHEIGGRKVYVTAASIGLIVVDAETGEMVLNGPETGNNIAVIPTAVLAGESIYHTSDYGSGNGLWKLSVNGGQVGGELVYAYSDKSMQNHHGGVVLVDGVIYGHTKVNRGQWMAQDLETGETLWSESLGRNTSGSIAYADGRLYLYGDKDATLHLVEPSREGLKQVGEVTLPEQTEIARKQGAIWAHPVIANQRLIIRDQDLIFAYDIAR
jgi:outer membrane protein assembly factor BamB